MIIFNRLRLNKSDLFYLWRNRKDYFSRDCSVGVWYFCSKRNVGDLVGPYLLQKILGKKIKRNIFGLRKHFLSVGSILDQATSQSLIWGSGLISKEKRVPKVCKNIILVRGYLTLNALGIRRNTGVRVGDPALMLPRFYFPEPKKRFKIGIIPHLSEFSILKKLITTLPESMTLINVQSEVEDFIDEILSCDCIFSSSLHGLIISDAYSIPNKWISLTENLDEELFKFEDYYSVFPGRKYSCLKVNLNELSRLLNKVSLCSVVNCDRVVEQIYESSKLLHEMYK